MLSDNKAALSGALSLSANALREVISPAFLYGSADTLGSVLNNQYDTVIGALFNADTDGVLESLAAVNPTGLIAGLLAAKKVLGTPEALLVLPREDGFATLRNAAQEAGISVVANDFVNVRAHKGDLLLHWATLAAISDLIAGNPQKIPVAVGGELIALTPGETLGALLPAENVKAVRIGARFFTPAVLGEPVRPELISPGGALASVSNDACIVQAAYEQIQKIMQKCCGVCTLCREGLFQLSAILRGITEAKSAPSEPALAEEISRALIDAALCSVGEAAAACVLSVLEGFGEELAAHIRGKKCPSGKCHAFAQYYVNPMKCTGCGECIDACPEDCIEGAPGYISMIDVVSCTKCGKCMDACPEGAVVRTQNRMPNLPSRLTKVGRFRR